MKKAKDTNAVNSALIEFYWSLGRDVTERYSEANLGNEFYRKMSLDLKDGKEEVKGLSPQTLKYCGYFYRLYVISAGGQQVVDLGKMQQVVAQLVLVPWGHHVQIIDKCKGDRDKALFYVRRTIQNGWSRNSLLNWLSSDLYESEGKAQTNFELKRILPTQAQLVKCYADAERQIAEKVAAKSGGKCLYATVYIKENGPDVKGQLDKLFGE